MRQPDIQPLRHRNREAPGCHGCDLKAVHCDQLAVERAEVDMKGAHRRAVDEAQQHAPARLDLDHLGIAERAVVGQEGVVCHIVQIRLGGRSAHGHARHRGRGPGGSWRRGAFHGRHGAAFLELLKNLLRRPKAEVGQHHDDVLLVRPVARIADDQRRRHQQLLLQSLVGVHPVRPAEAQGEIIVGAAARWYRRPRDARDAVLLPWRRQAVPMDQARLVDLVFHAHAEPLAHVRPDAEGPVGLLDSEDRRRLAVHLDAAALQPQHGWRRAAPTRAGLWRRLGSRHSGEDCGGRKRGHQEGAA